MSAPGDKAKAEVEWAARRCECGADDACAFARERDEARAEVEVLNKLLRQHRTASVGTIDRLEETEAELRKEIRRLNNEVFALRREGLRLATDLERAEARVK